MSRLIGLNNGMVTKVSEEDFRGLMFWPWGIMVAGKDRKRFVVCRHQWIDGKKYCILMHREILKAPDDLTVDHINGDTLDNTRTNLRFATIKQNRRNSSGNLISTSRYRGVHIFRDGPRLYWRAAIQVNGVKHSLGLFKTEKEAATAWNKSALEFFGEFARLNEVQSD